MYGGGVRLFSEVLRVFFLVSTCFFLDASVWSLSPLARRKAFRC